MSGNVGPETVSIEEMEREAAASHPPNPRSFQSGHSTPASPTGGRLFSGVIE